MSLSENQSVDPYFHWIHNYQPTVVIFLRFITSIINNLYMIYDLFQKYLTVSFLIDLRKNILGNNVSG